MTRNRFSSSIAMAPLIDPMAQHSVLRFFHEYSDPSTCNSGLSEGMDINIYGCESLCGKHCVGSTVWEALCGNHCVGSTVWESLCGNHCVGIIVWEPLCGNHCVGRTVWECCVILEHGQQRSITSPKWQGQQSRKCSNGVGKWRSPLRVA